LEDDDQRLYSNLYRKSGNGSIRGGRSSISMVYNNIESELVEKFSTDEWFECEQTDDDDDTLVSDDQSHNCDEEDDDDESFASESELFIPKDGKEGAPNIVLVIFMALALFLVTNGPSDWRQIWRELVDPSLDARHAIRRNMGHMSGFSGGLILPVPVVIKYADWQKFQKEEYKRQIDAIKQSLEQQLNDPRGTGLKLVSQILHGVVLSEEQLAKVSSLLKGLSVKNLRKRQKKLNKFANEKITNETIRGKFNSKIKQFIDYFQKLNVN